MALQLCRAGVHADVVLFGQVKECKEDARTNFEIVRRLATFETGSEGRPTALEFRRM